jgi:hypothetical protein
MPATWPLCPCSLPAAALPAHRRLLGVTCRAAAPAAPQVNDIPWPCSSLAALATEVDNPSQNGCKRNADSSVSGTLAAAGHQHFLQLLVATGLLPEVDKTATSFTIFAPSDDAVAAAAARGTFKYAHLFASNPQLLAQVVGYHIVAGQALKTPSPSSATRLSPTLMQVRARGAVAGRLLCRTPWAGGLARRREHSWLLPCHGTEAGCPKRATPV